MTFPLFASASSISASAPSIARIRPSISTIGWRRARRNGGSAARACARRDEPRALDPQDGLYALSVRGGEGEDLRIVGALRRLVVASEARRLLAAMSDPAVRIVTLTVTEKGYCHDPAKRRLDEHHPDIRHDLANRRRAAQRAGLYRRGAGAPPRGGRRAVHGRQLRQPAEQWRDRARGDRALGGVARRRPRPLGQGEVAFPSTMVDRIVPATTDEDRARIAARLGVEDAWPVVTEPFSQWVIEDRFPDRPAALRGQRRDAGWRRRALRTRQAPAAERRPFDARLSRLSRGYETVAEAMADENLSRLVAGLMDEEAAPTLDARATGDLAPYNRRVAGALPQSGAAPPDLADRDGRLAEAAAAPARHRRGRGSRSGSRSTVSRWGSRPGCAMSPASTSRAAPIDVRDPLGGAAEDNRRPRGPGGRAPRAGRSRMSARCSAPTSRPTRVSSAP